MRAKHGILAGLLRFARIVFTQAGSRPPEAEWSATIEQVVADLEHLNRSTEQDFLAVGGKLIEFRSVAQEVSSDVAALTELISGEHGRNASRALNRVVERAEAMSARLAQSGQALASVRDLSNRIRLAFAKLGETVSLFRTLCTLTRIETSLLGSAGADFLDLADEVKPLSESIQSSGQRVLDASAQLDQSVQGALRKGSDLSAREMRELHALLGSVGKSLRSFEERQQQAQEANHRQSALHAAVHAGIEDLVRSVQFHDITRQQIEHVCQALRQILSEFHHGSKKRSSPPPDARAVLALQSSQLSSAGLAFAASVAGIERDLENIGARVRDMAETGRTLMGFSGDDQDSFFAGMEGSFTSILHVVDACTAAEVALQCTAFELDETTCTMRAAVETIRGVEIDIQRIAINATIRAAQIGAAGEALNVIAGVMQRVALDSNGNTEDVAGALDSMNDANHRVGGADGVNSGGPADTAGVLDGMRQAILELHASSESSVSLVNQIAVVSSRLGDDIQSVRNGLSVGPLFAQAVARARGELERICTQAGVAGFRARDLAPVQDMERFTKHYTMQTERDVHESVAARATEATGEVLALAAPAGESTRRVDNGELGDNVELF